MDKTVGVIASDEELKKRIIELFKSDVENGEIIIDVLDLDRMDEQGRELERKGAKAIVARSGGYRHTRGTVNVPVIHLEVSTPDILQAIKSAKEYNKEIVLVIADLDYFDYEEWKDLINADIILERFHSKDEIYYRIQKYKDKREDVVIVGGGIPCSLAEELGLDNVFINASKESVYEAVNYARKMIENLYEQKYNIQALKTILDGVHDSVITVNHEGKIRLYNERAQALLKKPKEEVINRDLLEVFPEFDFIMDVLKDKMDRNNEIRTLGGITITANTAIFSIEGKIEGAVCSFQDISKLQSLEKKIRYELNKKGHVARYVFEDVLALGPSMKSLVEKSKSIGRTDSTVMIYGESGTGKEMIAQSMHNISGRKDEPFVAINCAAISESLLESELFGYEGGAFTGARKDGKPGLFELAHGGTIFLDEINSISLNLQSKFLRVLEERETMRIGSDYIIPLEIRVIAATNEELKIMVEEGRFRKDLFYRLNILELYIPPLRERKEDIIFLFNQFLKELSGDGAPQEISKEMEKRLLNYEWPGNVRELRSIVKRFVILGELDLGENGVRDNNYAIASKEVIDLKEINRFVEERVISMLSNQGMTKTEIAETLGISRTTLWNKMKDMD